MELEIVYGPGMVMDLVTPDEISDSDIQDFLVGKLTLHGTAPDGTMQSFGGRQALWVNRKPAAT